MLKLGLLLSATVLTACATHPISIEPKLRELSSEGALSAAHVAYFISPANYDKLLVQKSGGGDSVSYYPYRELEPALQKVLFERFEAIKRTEEPPTPQSMAADKLNYTFIPEFSALAFSDSAWTWPPTKFTLRCSIRAVDAKGKNVWTSKYEGVGTASFEEWRADFGLAAERAAGIVFKKMQKDLRALNL